MFRRSAVTLAEYNVIRAELRRKAFNSYKEQGFTDAEALELCKDAGKVWSISGFCDRALVLRF